MWCFAPELPDDKRSLDYEARKALFLRLREARRRDLSEEIFGRLPESVALDSIPEFVDEQVLSRSTREGFAAYEHLRQSLLRRFRERLDLAAAERLADEKADYYWRLHRPESFRELNDGAWVTALHYVYKFTSAWVARELKRGVKPSRKPAPRIQAANDFFRSLSPAERGVLVVYLRRRGGPATDDLEHLSRLGVETHEAEGLSAADLEAAVEGLSGKYKQFFGGA